MKRIIAVYLLLVLIACGNKGTNKESPDDYSKYSRPVIYQLVVRYFSNINETRKTDGSIAENGVGKFDDIDSTAIEALKSLGITHIWLSGILEQATGTDWSSVGSPADDPDILKGIAGSFFAVKDYFDTSPDYATNPSNRLEELKALISRIHAAGLKVMIDIVPNHVARSYHSDIRPELDFGKDDDTSVFFSPQNNFFYLVDPPDQSLCLPSTAECASQCGHADSPLWSGRPEGCDCTFEPETPDGSIGVPRVSGNNQTSASPSAYDWYETVKLNYGYNFVTGEKRFDPIPDTWKKMDEIIKYWQEEFDVDGFRCDFAHFVPVEFWAWEIARAKERNPNAFFVAEAYEKQTELVEAGFDAVYDDPLYDSVKRIFCCGGWANDIDEVLPSDFMFGHVLRYSENHDERRIASPIVSGSNPDDSGFGSAKAGMPVSVMLYLQASGPVLVFNGQEVGEPGAGVEGFGGNDGRTTIFDYWSMPEMVKWVNGHKYDGGRLADWQRQLRGFYGDLSHLINEEPFVTGNFYGLNYFNRSLGSWDGGENLYAFLRYLPNKRLGALVVVNFSDSRSFDGVYVAIPKDALNFMGFDSSSSISVSPKFGFADAQLLTGSQAELQGIKVSLPPLGFAVLMLQ